MTREEAIRVLKYGTAKAETKYKALDMAIKALEQEPCEDCVSRAEVLNLVRFNAFHVKSQIKAIENLPPVTPTHIETVTEFADRCVECGNRYGKQLKQLREQTKWISVNERLPEDFQRVLVTIVNYNGDKVARVAEYSRRTFKIKENYEHWQVGEKGLLAWRPLPEPYKAEMESKE